jgi:squalene-hopene/tetraprenyl-beta-curcumene cyclase
VTSSPGPRAVTHPRPSGQAATRDAAAEALSRARKHLLGLQHEQGWWQGELETNVTMDAEDLMLREFLGIRTAEQTQAAARWIVAKQRDDGTWANFYGGPGDLSTTVEAYIALRLAGHLPNARHMARAAAWIRDQGGIPATRVFTRIWLALFGEWSWDDLPVMPPELIYFPAWFPLNVYDFACWARQTIVPLTIVGTIRPAKQLPFGIKELWPGASGVEWRRSGVEGRRQGVEGRRRSRRPGREEKSRRPGWGEGSARRSAAAVAGWAAAGCAAAARPVAPSWPRPPCRPLPRTRPGSAATGSGPR